MVDESDPKPVDSPFGGSDTRQMQVLPQQQHRDLDQRQVLPWRLKKDRLTIWQGPQNPHWQFDTSQ